MKINILFTSFLLSIFYFSSVFSNDKTATVYLTESEKNTRKYIVADLMKRVKIRDITGSLSYLSDEVVLVLRFSKIVGKSNVKPYLESHQVAKGLWIYKVLNNGKVQIEPRGFSSWGGVIVLSRLLNKIEFTFNNANQIVSISGWP